MSNYSTSYKPFPEFTNWISNIELDLETILDRIDNIQNESKSRFDAAVEFVAKAAAVDTGAIERLYETDRGFTYAVAAQVNTIAFIQNRRGDEFATHFQDQMNAYEMIVDFATENRPLVQALIRQLHSTICATQNTYSVSVNGRLVARPLKKGQYKTEPNTVTKADGTQHHYCPVEQVEPEMQRLLEETHSVDFKSSSGIVKAAFVHHCLTLIHPFSDGNGRISRALASVYLIQDFGIPLLIFADQRDMYFDSLEAADAGNSEELVNFFYDRLWETINVIDENMSRTSKIDLANSTEELKQKLLNKDASFDSRLEAAVLKLFKLCVKMLNSEKAAHDMHLADLYNHISLNFGSIPNGEKYRATATDKHRRTIRDDTTLYISVKSKDPATSYIKYLTYDFLIPVEESNNGEILLIQTQPPTNYKATYARMSEIENTTKQALEYRIQQWAKNVLAEAVSDFNNNI